MQRSGNAMGGINEVERQRRFNIAAALWPAALASTTTALSSTSKHLAKEIAHVAAIVETESALPTWPAAAKTHWARSTYLVVFFAFLFVAQHVVGS